MQKKYCKLIMVAVDVPGGASNSNKYYEMTWNEGADIIVNYGRVDHTKVTINKPAHHWDKLIKEKVNKGYKDVTDLVTIVEKKEDIKFSKIDGKVGIFMDLMSLYTNNLVTKTYSVKSDNVSQKQVNEAQSYLNTLSNLIHSENADSILIKTDTLQKVNDLLIKLYTIIPRHMNNVKHYVLPNIKLSKLLIQEQDNLDAMALQVSINKPVKTSKTDKKINTLLDRLGITMKECEPNKDIQYLLNQIKKNGNKVTGIFEVNKSTEDKVFENWISKQKNKATRILIHGTRCTSVIPILEIGLKIRPAGNFQFSGKVYGNGNYYSETVVKSLGYTGYDDDKILLVYEVHVGNPFKYTGWYKGNSFTLNYKNLQERGFDSTFVEAGNGLLNSEIIAYKEEQCHIKYIIHLKK